jgi:hypothetical protein
MTSVDGLHPENFEGLTWEVRVYERRQGGE